MEKILCTGKADQFGYCDKCHNRIYGTSVYCNALVDPAPPSSPTVTAEEIQKFIDRFSKENGFGLCCDLINNFGHEVLIKILQEYASLKEQEARRQAIQECLPLIERCEKTFGKIDEIFKLLLEAKSEDLYSLVREIDIDLPLIQATIKDELSKLK